MTRQPKQLTGEEFGNELLVVVEEHPSEFAKQLASFIRKALGLPEQQQYIPAPFRPRTPSEFPQWRIKYGKDGNEIARRRVESMRDLERLFNSEREMVWQQSFAVPIEENK